MDFPVTETMDRKACLEWLEAYFHPNGLKCPHCEAGYDQANWFRKTKRSDLDVYRCKVCRGIYNLYSGTVFDGRYFTPEQTVLFIREVLQGKSSAKLARERWEKKESGTLIYRIHLNAGQTNGADVAPTRILALIMSRQERELVMLDTRIILSGLWVATMLTYLWGDVLRIMAGHVEPGKLEGVQATQGMWLFIATIMLVPIVMVVLTLTLPYPAIRWVSIIVTILVAVFNIFGLPYKGAYDNFLIIVSFVFNALTIWYAWRWVA